MSKLGEIIHRENKAREAAECAEIVGDGSVSAEGRGKFATACEVARRETADMEFSQAQHYLLKHPYLVDSPGGKGTFFEKFPNAPMDKLREIVGRLYEVRHPSNTDGDAPTAESGQIAYRSRPR